MIVPHTTRRDQVRQGARTDEGTCRMSTGRLEDRLRAVVGSGLRASRWPSCGLMADRPLLGAGQADLARGMPASPQMVRPWFSMTKIVTATAAMRLAERGALDLDEPIGPHIPQFGRLRQARAQGALQRATS